ncbi:tRNA dihydrouridine synthase DusB [Roseovarius sp. LXJ103]|uniref:tRNA dihydrouridine synthase DusB n=1 Tax=Roseovarius carneus TaxID=2853164 RepID=UPI000D61E207|nr:tRNA dihydrouridine synthase DusB [Roseovarius carneus]MBZ8119396.1 tRNA dihydrouridine synthase DusB [Roseovarius carneus]PWE34958.1 tRNA dihydrouridine synthase DusB [Pelagicola sp. LXJ1103]
MPLDLKTHSLDPPVLLAPLAGITDLPFRNLVAGFGAGLVVSEMIASQEMVQARRGAREKAELGFGARASAVQIAGREAHWMAEAARIAAANGAQIIDINMGCPAKKVTSASGAGASGSALMKDLDHALGLIEAVVGAVDVPVTLKTRLGWDDALLNAPDLARRAENAGIAMITIHGRTRCQFYKGHADWAAIRAVKDAVHIPVVANGDIVDAQTARQALVQSGADGIMVGRGAQGRPWILAELAHDLFGTPAPDAPCGARFSDMIAEHYEAMLAFYGPKLGLRVARKHLGWYLVDAPQALRKEILTSAAPEQVLRLIPGAVSELRQAA